MATSVNYEVKHDLTKLAVVAVCFNAVNYNTRYHLYRQFEEHMLQSGVFLFTVECIFESAPVFGLPKQTYEVTQPNNPRHLQLTASSILWMKENLINVAVKHLPAHIEYVAWIDTDIEFDRLDWAHLVIDELQRYPIVQLFELAHFLGPNGKSEILRRDYSFAYSIKHNKPIDSSRYNEWYPHPGYAWAMRRTAFNTIGGLCEFSILGSGDLHFAYALLNRTQETFPKNLNKDYRRSVIAWADPVAQLSNGGHNVGYVPVNIWHHWHGSRNDRGYVERWGILERYQFAPSKDLERNNQTGIIGLVNKRSIGKLQLSVRMIALERDIVAYFLSRKEDSTFNVPKPIQTVKYKSNSAQTPTYATSDRKNLPSFPSNFSRPTPNWVPNSTDCQANDDVFPWVDCTCLEHHDNDPHDPDCSCCMYYHEEHNHNYENEDCCNSTSSEEYYDAEGEHDVSPDCDKVDQDHTRWGNESNEYQRETTNTSPGSFY